MPGFTITQSIASIAAVCVAFALMMAPITQQAAQMMA
jgi:hypothetical protein